MSSPRWLAGLVVPVIAGAALMTTSAPIATADPTNDAYLAQLRAAGFTFPPDHEQAVIGMGLLICDDLGWGWTPEQIARDVHGELDSRGVVLGQVDFMVGLAHATYCPNQRCWAPHC